MHAHGILIVSPAVDFFADSPCLRQILKRTDIIWNQLEGYAFSVRTFLIFLNGRDIHGTGNDADLIKNRKAHASRILREAWFAPRAHHPVLKENDVQGLWTDAFKNHLKHLNQEYIIILEYLRNKTMCQNHLRLSSTLFKK